MKHSTLAGVLGAMAMISVAVFILAGPSESDPTMAFVDDGTPVHSTPATNPDGTSRPSGVTTPGDGPPPTSDVAPTTTIAVPAEFLANFPTPGTRFFGVTTEAKDLGDVASFAAAAEKRPTTFMFSQGWVQWDDGSGPQEVFNSELVEEITRAGMLPIVAWEPWDFREENERERLRGEQPEWALARITAGDHDAYIERYAADVAAWGHPIGIRLAHEMNGYWYPWGGEVNGNTPAEYGEMWRHVHAIFAAAGADNVTWIWSPNVPYGEGPDYASMYPGDDYVDWVGIVGYFWPDPDAGSTDGFPNFVELFGEGIGELRSFTQRPLVITETGAGEVSGADKPAFIAHIVDEMAAFENLLGFIWFEVDKEADWRIESSEAARTAFATAIANPIWGGIDTDEAGFDESLWLGGPAAG